jgi:hypothetical protein
MLRQCKGKLKQKTDLQKKQTAKFTSKRQKKSILYNFSIKKIQYSQRLFYLKKELIAYK